jgi:preprotein translocase subunit SecD
MKSSLNIVAILSLPLPIYARSQTGAEDKPLAQLEIKRAEVEAAENLTEVTVQKTGAKIFLSKTPDITNDDIADASIDHIGDELLLKLKFTKQGQARMKKLTKEHNGKPLAVLLDGKVLVAPTIASILSEQAVFTGIAKPDLERIVKSLKAK